MMVRCLVICAVVVLAAVTVGARSPPRRPVCSPHRLPCDQMGENLGVYLMPFIMTGNFTAGMVENVCTATDPLMTCLEENEGQYEAQMDACFPMSMVVPGRTVFGISMGLSYALYNGLCDQPSEEVAGHLTCIVHNAVGNFEQCLEDAMEVSGLQSLFGPGRRKRQAGNIWETPEFQDLMKDMACSFVSSLADCAEGVITEACGVSTGDWASGVFDEALEVVDLELECEEGEGDLDIMSRIMEQIQKAQRANY